MLNERDYFNPKYQAMFSCTEREALLRLRARWLAGAFNRDVWLNPKRVLFARHLYQTGRIGEGVESYGAARQFAP